MLLQIKLNCKQSYKEAIATEGVSWLLLLASIVLEGPEPTNVVSKFSFFQLCSAKKNAYIKPTESLSVTGMVISLGRLRITITRPIRGHDHVITLGQ